MILSGEGCMEVEKARVSASLLSYGLLVMTVTHTLTHAFGRIHTALFPILKSPQEFNLTLQQLGIVAAIPPLCQALLSIPVGLLSDRVGAKKLILVSLAIAASGSILASRARDPVTLIIAISLLYMNTSIYHPSSYSFTTRLFSPRNRPGALGIHGAGGTLGMAIGPISVSILMGLFAFGWRDVYFFWAIPTVLGAISVLMIKYEPTTDAVEDDRGYEPQYQNDTDSLLSLALVMFLVFISIRQVAMQMVSTFFTTYLVFEKGFGEALSSLIYGGSSLLGLVSAPIGGLLASRYGEKKWLMVALSLAYISLGLAITLPNVAAFVIFYLCYGFCNTLGMAANSAIVARLTPSRRRGLGYALYFLPGSIMGAVAPIIAAHIADAFGLGSIFTFALAVYVVGLVVFKVGVNMEPS